MVNKNLFNAAVLGLGLTLGYSVAYAQEEPKSGEPVVGESVANPDADTDCPDCPPKAQAGAQDAAASQPADTQKPKLKKKFVPKGDCTELYQGNGR